MIVSDYAAGDEGSWAGLRLTLAGLAAQRYEGHVEFLLVENEAILRRLPADVCGIIPSLRQVASAHRASYELKNHGVAEARTELVAVLDADCHPRPGWIANIFASFRTHPDVAAVSGRTRYEARDTTERLLGLLSRSYYDAGTEGPTGFISNNNSAFRRTVFLAHPMPPGLGAFASRIQSEAILREGGKLWFDPSIEVVHDFEGWRMELDIRRNLGYGTVITRLADGQMPYAPLIRLGPVSIPAIVAGKILTAWGDCLRCWRHFGVRSYELPLAFPLASYLALLEIPGMLAAFRGRPLGETAYR